MNEFCAFSHWTSPQFDDEGYVVSLDANGTFLSDFRRYLDDARAHNILVFATLWNGASVSRQYKRLLQGLLTDTSKLQSYIDHALVPWVRAVKDHPALGGWDIINEMEGVIITGEKENNPCFDTRFLEGSTAGFAEELNTSTTTKNCCIKTMTTDTDNDNNKCENINNNKGEIIINDDNN
nr:hypothetical protein BaRGS_005442 [Batillaria attramentaria]